MKMINIKKFFHEISKNKLTLLVCVFVSVVLWILTIMFNNDSHIVVTVHNVPVDLSLYNTRVEQLGMSVIDFYPKYISVDVKGPRHKVGLITNDDILVNPRSLSGVVSSGSYNLDLTASLKKKQQDVDVENISSRNVFLKVDTLENKLVNLVPEALNVRVEDGYIKDEAVCQPDKLFVSGPKQSIDNLDVIKLSADFENKILNSTKILDANLKFISSAGKEMDKNLFEYSDVNFTLTVPVYKFKRVPLTVCFNNAPENLNKNIIKPTVTPSFIDIGGPDDVLENINEVNVGFVDLRELTEDKNNFSLNLSLPPNLKNISQVTSVNVSFNKDNFKSKNLNVKGIEVINIPEGYNVSVNSKTIEGVKVMGLKPYIDSVNESDLTAVVDLSGVEVKCGTQKIAVNIGVINKNGIWVAGKYKCPITIDKNKD